MAKYTAKKVARIRKNKEAAKSPEIKAPINPKQNTQDYSIETAVHEILLGTDLTGRAESGFITAIYNDDQWQATKDKKTNKWNYPVANYWNAPEKNTDKNGKRIEGLGPTRAQHASAFLMKFEEYADVAAKLTTAKADLKTATKQEAHIAASIHKAAIDKYEKKINAAHSMFSRAMASVYLLRSKADAQGNAMDVAKVKLGEHNQVLVENSKGELESYKSSGLRDRGIELLRKDSKMKPAVARNSTKKGSNGTSATVPAVNALTARTVLQGFDKLLDQEAFNPPLNSDDQGTVVNKNDLAEHALRIVTKFTNADATGSAELRGTISQIIVALIPVLGIKTLKDAQSLATNAVNKAA
jgi:hypothetical protein